MKNETVYVSGNAFDSAFDMESQPIWKAAASCPFCGTRTHLRMSGEYIERIRYGQTTEYPVKILTSVKTICVSCGAAGPVEKKFLPGREFSTSEIDSLRLDNKRLMLTAISKWNRRYT